MTDLVYNILTLGKLAVMHVFLTKTYKVKCSGTRVSIM